MPTVTVVVWRDKMPSAQDVAREYFPDASDEELEHIIWEHTGYPEFWPDGSKTPEENFRMQLQEFKDVCRSA
jgi:hypothetical protein